MPIAHACKYVCALFTFHCNFASPLFLCNADENFMVLCKNMFAELVKENVAACRHMKRANVASNSMNTLEVIGMIMFIS